jgi:hypothetical protein
MTSADASGHEPACRGELRFVEASALPQLRGTAAAASMLYAEMPFLSAALRGQLGEFIDAAVEDELARRHFPRSAAPVGDFHMSLAEQLTRARSAGFRGLVVVIGALHEVAGVAGVLDPDDSAALRAWVASTQRQPVTVLLDRRNLSLAGYSAPQRLDALLGWTEPVVERPAPRLRRVPNDPTRDRRPPPEMIAEAPPPAPAPPEPEAPAVEPINTRMYAEELHAARGPKPLGVVERMFISRYVPLAEAEMRGQLDGFGRQVRSEWAASFARSYTEAFQALRVTGKRPAMVFDVPQLAARVARLHGARAVELLLVDGMRYDLGLRVQDRLARAFEGKAACAETMLLWSALPSTTPTQLDLLAHGIEALNRPLPGEEPDSLHVARGRNVTVARRVKMGQRDLVKIDVVEARLRDAGPPLPDRLDQIADEVTQGVVRHADTLPERTLLLVFGDHGFVADTSPSGSSPARQGGASPEEVLVPGFAWLLGGVH